MTRLRGSTFALLVVLGGCALGAAPTPKTYRDTIAPTLTASSARAHVAQPLTIVIPPSIAEQATITRGQGQVVVHIQNFKSAIGATLAKAFANNFSAVSVAPGEAKQGIELVILDVRVGKDVDTLSYHVALTYNGTDVYEARGEIQPATRVVQTNIYTWKDGTAELTTEFAAENIATLAEELNGKLLINDDPRLMTFWKEVQAPSPSSGGETAPAAPLP